LKTLLLKEVLPTITTKYILGLDSRDVFVTEKIDQIIPTFEKEFNCEMLYNAELCPWPNNETLIKLEKNMLEVETPFKYLNGGVWLAKTEFYKTIVDDIINTEHLDEIGLAEQDVLKQIYIKHWPKIKIDQQCKLFQNTQFLLESSNEQTIKPISKKEYRIKIFYGESKNWVWYKKAMYLKKYAPKNFQVDICDVKQTDDCYLYDLVFSIPYQFDQIKQNILKNNSDCLLVSSYNRGFGHSDDLLNDIIDVADFAIINNYEMWDKFGKFDRTFTISNGVDLEIFKPYEKVEDRKFKVLWVGSEFHKEVKRYDIVEQIADGLDSYGIDYDFKLVDSHDDDTILTHKQMVDWYNKGTIYIITSDTEGTPNPALEAAACGNIILSTKVGNMTELIQENRNGFFCDDANSFLEKILELYKRKDVMTRLSNNIISDIQDWSWDITSKKFFNLFEKLIKENK